MLPQVIDTNYKQVNSSAKAGYEPKFRNRQDVWVSLRQMFIAKNI